MDRTAGSQYQLEDPILVRPASVTSGVWQPPAGSPGLRCSFSTTRAQKVTPNAATTGDQRVLNPIIAPTAPLKKYSNREGNVQGRERSLGMVRGNCTRKRRGDEKIPLNTN
jgi:hypothetical protein